MPHYGPWVTPPEQIVNLSQIPASYVTRGEDATSYAVACEETTSGIVGDNQFATAQNFSVPHVDNDLAYVNITSALGSFVDYSPSLPPGATGVDYEGAGPNAAWLTTVHTAFSLLLQNISATDAVVQARAMNPAFNPITGGISFQPGTVLSTLALIGSVGLPAGTNTTGTIAVVIPATSISPGAPGVSFATALLHFDGQISHVGPTDGNQWLIQVDHTTAIAVAVHYQPRRYRFIFPVPPPQRQFPRDDGLGISTRRSWPPVTSKQFGQRRGASATYQ